MRPSKKEEILQRSLTLFYKYGFHATGVDFIVKKTGISKTSIYSNFENKEALMLAVLERRDENFRNWLTLRIEALASNPLEKLYCIFDTLEEWFSEANFSGCMFVKASSEYQDTKHPIYLKSAEHKQKLTKYFVKLAEQAKVQDPVAIANHIVILKEGAITAAHLKLIKKPGLHAKAILKLIIENDS